MSILWIKPPTEKVPCIWEDWEDVQRLQNEESLFGSMEEERRPQRPRSSSRHRAKKTQKRDDFTDEEYLDCGTLMMMDYVDTQEQTRHSSWRD
jgi:hypothetical protein